MGFIFGGRIGNDVYVYTIGYVNLDETSPYTNQANYNLTEIYKIIEKTDAFHLRYYNNDSQAIKNLEDENLDAVVVFQGGFQEYLNSSSEKKYAIYDNDTTSANPVNYTHQIEYFVNITSS